MNWIDTTYEKAMHAYFIKELDKVKGESLYSDYTSIRNAMLKDNFFGEIKGQEPNLSDHSETHIQDVFERAYKIIGEDEFLKFSVYEIYCLALMILFHDVGNIFGRVGHDAIEKIADIYNKYRQTPKLYRDERRLVTTGASAHSGKTKDGSTDTLKSVNEGSIKGNKINLSELASILRFADELAEGKQRTCSLLIERNLIDKDSEIYHSYAEITDIEIDRGLERISITYDIDIPIDFNNQAQEKFKKLILFTYSRAVKLDVERRYTKNYSLVLRQFKYVTVQYNFSLNEIPIDLELNGVTFEDQYPIPGENSSYSADSYANLFIEKDKEFDLTRLIANINSKITK